MWFIGVEVEQETSAPRPKKNPGSAPGIGLPTLASNCLDYVRAFSSFFSPSETGSRKQHHSNRRTRTLPSILECYQERSNVYNRSGSNFITDRKSVV